ARIPDLLKFGLIALLGEMVITDLAIRCDIGVAVSGRENLNAFRSMEVKCPNRRVEVVATEITQGAATQRPKIPPGYRRAFFMARHVWRRAQPQVPSDGLLICGRPRGQAL